MTFRLLFDECLSPELVRTAVGAGFVESTCVRDRGWSGMKDWDLVQRAVDGNFTLVTLNATDFRGNGPDKPGGHFSRHDVHPGLICLSSERRMSIDRQHDLFEVALKELVSLGDLVNRVLEVHETLDGTIDLTLYELPVHRAAVPVQPADQPPFRDGRGAGAASPKYSSGTRALPRSSQG